MHLLTYCFLSFVLILIFFVLFFFIIINILQIQHQSRDPSYLHPFFEGSGKTIRAFEELSSPIFGAYQSPLPCNTADGTHSIFLILNNNKVCCLLVFEIGVCSFGDIRAPGSVAGYVQVFAVVGGVLSNPLRLMVTNPGIHFLLQSLLDYFNC